MAGAQEPAWNPGASTFEQVTGGFLPGKEMESERERKKTNKEHDDLEALLVAHGALRLLLALGSLSAVNLMGVEHVALWARCLRWSWVTDEQFSPPCAESVCMLFQHAVFFSIVKVADLSLLRYVD